MAPVTLYTKQGCQFSQRARMLLARKGVRWDDLDITDDPRLRAEMEQRSHGGTSTPQVFVNGSHVGGFEELEKLEKGGELDVMLGADSVDPSPS